MRLTLNQFGLSLLLRDLEETATLREKLSGMWVKMSPGDGGHFIAYLTKGQVRRLTRTIPLKTIEERYG